MNFPPNRVQPEQIEPCTSTLESEYSGYEEVSGTWLYGALIIWSLVMFACGWTARYFF